MDWRTVRGGRQRAVVCCVSELARLRARKIEASRKRVLPTCRAVSTHHKHTYSYDTRLSRCFFCSFSSTTFFSELLEQSVYILMIEPGRKLWTTETVAVDSLKRFPTALTSTSAGAEAKRRCSCTFYANSSRVRIALSGVRAYGNLD